MERLLQKAGYQVHIAADALSANFQLVSNKFDLLLADIALAGEVNGIEVARNVNARYPALKVMFITGFDVPDGLSSSTMILCKPIAPEKLILEVQSALGRRQH